MAASLRTPPVTLMGPILNISDLASSLGFSGTPVIYPGSHLIFVVTWVSVIVVVVVPICIAGPLFIFICTLDKNKIE